MNPVYVWTGDGLVSASADLARWMERLFESPDWCAIGAAMVAGKAADSPYGLGIFVRDAADGPVYGHPGGYPGYHTEVGYSPALGVGIAFQANRDRVDGRAAIDSLLAVVRRGRGDKTP